MSPVRYWVVKSASDEVGVVAHFKSEAEANEFITSDFYLQAYKAGTIECVFFDIFETAVEAESNFLDKLKESGLLKLKLLTPNEAMALGIAHLLPTESK